ncbi:MAG: OsmC family protein [Planctomycetes bacterium]|nr:OsmC family protein [Planctomycetota bacterium]
MSVQIDLVYEGQLHTRATHGPSGAAIATDAPVDNGGKGSAFSPTDLVAAALGACMITIMGKVAERHAWDLSGTRVRVFKEMIQQPVRRIGALRATITVPRPLSATLSVDDRKRLENAAETCPVRKSLHPDVQLPVEFIYE